MLFLTVLRPNLFPADLPAGCYFPLRPGLSPVDPSAGGLRFSVSAASRIGLDLGYLARCPCQFVLDWCSYVLDILCPKKEKRNANIKAKRNAKTGS